MHQKAPPKLMNLDFGNNIKMKMRIVPGKYNTHADNTSMDYLFAQHLLYFHFHLKALREFLPRQSRHSKKQNNIRRPCPHHRKYPLKCLYRTKIGNFCRCQYRRRKIAKEDRPKRRKKSEKEKRNLLHFCFE